MTCEKIDTDLILLLHSYVQNNTNSEGLSANRHLKSIYSYANNSRFLFDYG